MNSPSQVEIVQIVRQLAEGKPFPLKVARQAMIQWALVSSGGNVSRAAHLLGTSRGTIYRYARD